MERVQKLFGTRRRDSSELELGEGDLLILADAYWSKPEIWEHVRAARSRGAFIVVVLHDLIPLTHPQLVPPKFVRGFRQYLLQAVGNADFIVAVSQTVRDELSEKLRGLLPELSSIPPIDAFRNGADFTDHTGPVRNEIIQLFSKGQQSAPYITVSTFDPRKNHAFTLAAFEHLWSQGSAAGLLFVGTYGWMCDGLLKKIRAHALFGKRLNVFHDLSDAELSYCYQRARGAISSSLIEGFGLTIVESLWHGRKTFASDTPIHREVGGPHATYFSLESPTNLARAVEAWEAEIAGGAEIAKSSVRPMSWRASMELLLERCDHGYQMSLADVIPMHREPLGPFVSVTRAPNAA